MRLVSLVWGAVLSSCVGAFIVPDQLVSLLTVVYSVIPPIKKGSDSRVGFGYRFGPFADVQVLLELGPQTETRPISTESTSGKRDVDPGKRPDIQVLDVPYQDGVNARSARSRPSPAPVAAPPPPQPTGRSDWLSRWRSSVNTADVAASRPVSLFAAPDSTPEAAVRRYAGGSRPRPVRAPAPTPRGYPVPAPAPAPVPQRKAMSAEARWDAMRRLRSLHWAGQQGG